MRPPSPFIIAALGVLSGCLIDVCVKYLSGDINVVVITVWRFVFGGLYSLAVFIVLRRPWPGLEAWRFHAMRGAIHLSAALTFFFALTQLGLAEATVMGFTAALMIAPIAWLLLGERFGPLSVGAAVIGFAGAALTLTGETNAAPQEANRLLGAVSVLVSAFAYATSVVLLRMRAQREDTVTILMMANVLPALIGLPLLAAIDPVPAMGDLPVLAALGFFGMGIWWLFTLAYARAPARRIAPLEYTALIWSALFGWVFFGEVPGWQLYAGALIIIAACLMVAFEHRFSSRREAHQPVSDIVE
ncbi:MAG: EamA family transporter [Alphaproteobacteria bacterium]|jgi:S-adenosylmethionine uptake transporter|nr:EamA family transporter [Alphaproteobacteria bacterium]